MFKQGSIVRLVAIVLAFSCWHVVCAHSTLPPPIRRLAELSTLALEILPRQQSEHAEYHRRSVLPDSTTLHHTDSFRLTISAFDEEFYLHLRPNEHLIHPAARVSYFTPSPDGTSVHTHTEPLLRESVRAYWGEVIPAHLTDSRMREDAAGIVRQPQQGSELGWAMIMIHDQGNVDEDIAPLYEGVFSVNGDVHHVLTKENYLRSKHPYDPDLATMIDDPESSLVMWRESDVVKPHAFGTGHTGEWFDGHISPQPHACGLERFAHNTDPSLNALLRKRSDPTSWYNRSPVRRDDVAGAGSGANFVNSIGKTDGCPKTQKIVLMGVAADCVYTSTYGTVQNATSRILTNWNTASTLYKLTFNVSLGIIELKVSNPTCPTTPDPTTPWNVNCDSVQLNDRLSLFSDWRGRKGNDGAGLWHLMSGCPTGSEVGIAWLGTLCQQTSGGKAPSIVSGTAVSTAGPTEWQVIAHEIGHNFGAIHDCTASCNATSSCCPLSGSTCDANSKFLMSPTANAGEMNFSPCSMGNVCSLMTGIGSGQTTNTTCLLDPNPRRKLFSLQMCGNGIVEEGEDCDPGSGVTSPCCDSRTCKFNPGAVCDPNSSPCCSASCAFAPATQVCRPSRDSSCDIPEMCTGNSSACPADTFVPNGKSCGSGGLACASGQCTSISKQCQTAGASMGLSQPCPRFNDQSCSLSCQDPQNPQQCVLLQTPLVDGSPCGVGGTCSKGTCQPGNFASTAKAWFTSNLQISIPVTIVAGIVALLLLALFYRLLRRCFCGSSSRGHGAPDPGFRGLPGQRIPSWGADAGYAAAIPAYARPPPPIPPRGSTLEPYSNYSVDVPAALQPGSNAAFNRSPPIVPGRERSSFAAYPYSPHAPQQARRTPHGLSPQRDHWVDTTPYNG